MEGLNATYGAQDIPACSRESLIGGSQGSKIASAQRSGLIWVQNPCRYVAMSRKVPPQAVTSRRRGGIEGLGIWLRISRAERSEGGYRKAGMPSQSSWRHGRRAKAIMQGAHREDGFGQRKTLFSRRLRSTDRGFVRIMLATHWMLTLSVFRGGCLKG